MIRFLYLEHSPMQRKAVMSVLGRVQYCECACWYAGFARVQTLRTRPAATLQGERTRRDHNHNALSCQFAQGTNRLFFFTLVMPGRSTMVRLSTNGE